MKALKGSIRLRWKNLAFLALLGLLLTACNRASPAPLTGSPSPAATQPANPAAQASSASTPSKTPFQPSPTPQPLAARVNGVEIGLTDYQAELARYQAAGGKTPTPADQKTVLDDLIDQALLARGAAEKGYTVDDTTLKQRIDQLVSQLGSPQALNDWMASHGYVEATFRADLARSIAAAWMRDQIISAVPQAVEQVHARQILVHTSDEASKVLAELQGGADFAQLAEKYNPITLGDLGWFPRGYLTDPKLDDAAFSLEAGKISGVIQTSSGFYILQVIERDPQRPLEPDARLTLQSQALTAWLADRRNKSTIQVLLP